MRPFLHHQRSRRWLALAVPLLALAAIVGPSGFWSSDRLPPATAATAEVTIGGSATVAAGATRLTPSGAPGFPMAPSPRCDILSNFGDARSGGRAHEGVDMLATLGQPVYAVVAGTLTTQFTASGPDASLSGNAWRLVDRSGDLYFYAHLSAFAPALAVGSVVTAGQLIGYVGDTGNAGPGNYHLHFEYHPKGGAAVDPLGVLTIPVGCRVYWPASGATTGAKAWAYSAVGPRRSPPPLPPLVQLFAGHGADQFELAVDGRPRAPPRAGPRHRRERPRHLHPEPESAGVGVGHRGPSSCIASNRSLIPARS